MRLENLWAETVGLSIKNNQLISKEYSKTVNKPTQSFNEMTDVLYELFKHNYDWSHDVRAVSVKTSNLRTDIGYSQVNMFENIKQNSKREKLEVAMESIRAKHGVNSIEIASLTNDIKIIKNKPDVKVLPSAMHK